MPSLALSSWKGLREGRTVLSVSVLWRYKYELMDIFWGCWGAARTLHTAHYTGQQALSRIFAPHSASFASDQWIWPTTRMQLNPEFWKLSYSPAWLLNVNCANSKSGPTYLITTTKLINTNVCNCSTKQSFPTHCPFLYLYPRYKGFDHSHITPLKNDDHLRSLIQPTGGISSEVVAATIALLVIDCNWLESSI